jgi:hypothetical protein
VLLAEMRRSQVAERELHLALVKKTQATETGALFCNALLFPGIKHMCANSLKDATNVMAAFPQFWSQLRQLEMVLRNKDRRRRLQETCFHNSAFYDLFSTWTQSLKSWRWHDLVDFLQALLPLEGPLREGWSLAKWNSVGKQKACQEGDSADEYDASKLDQALRSSFFWEYAGMLRDLGEATERLSHWAEGCECHEGKNSQGCPMKGCRAPDFAAGVPSKLLEESQRLLDSKMLVKLGRLAPPDRQALLQDYNLGRAKLELTCHVKLSLWGLIPWKLCGIASSNVLIARQIAQDCITDWDIQSPAQKQSRHHLLTRRFLDPAFDKAASPWPGLREDVEDFAASGIMSDRLARDAARFRVIRCTERHVEGRHAEIGRVYSRAPAASAAYVSQELRFRELVQKLADPKACAVAFLGCSHVRPVLYVTQFAIPCLLWWVVCLLF